MLNVSHPWRTLTGALGHTVLSDGWIWARSCVQIQVCFLWTCTSDFNSLSWNLLSLISLLFNLIKTLYSFSLLPLLPPYSIFSTQDPMTPLEWKISDSKPPAAPLAQVGVWGWACCRHSSGTKQSFIITPKDLTGKRLALQPIHFHMKFTIDCSHIIKGLLRFIKYNSSILNGHEKEFKSFSPVCKKLLWDDSY